LVAASSPGDRRDARQRAERHGRLAEAATGGATAPVEQREDHPAGHGAEEGHLGGAHEWDHLAVHLEGHAGGVDQSGDAVVMAAAMRPATTVVRRSDLAERAVA
jgi:hypothetical protein